MIIMKKVNALLMFLLLTCSAASCSCLGWFGIDEYAKEVAIIKDYMVKWAGINQDANKLISWLEKRIAYTDISSDCLIGIVQILSDENLNDTKKISKLRRMMQHYKMTRIKAQLAHLKEQVTGLYHELGSTKKALFITQGEFLTEKARSNIQHECEKEGVQVAEDVNSKISKEKEMKISKKEKIEMLLKQEEQNKKYIYLAKEGFALCLGMLGAMSIGMPLAIAGTRYADGLVKFYTDQWKKN